MTISNTTDRSRVATLPWVGGIIAIVMVVKLVTSSDDDTAVADASGNIPSVTDAALKAAEEMLQARRRKEFLDAKAGLESVLDAISTLEDTTARWNKATTELLANSDGRRIASSTPDTIFVRVLLRKERRASDDFEGAREAAKMQLATVRKALQLDDDKLYELPGGLLDVEKERQVLEDVREEYDTDLKQLSSLAAKARDEHRPEWPSTLASRIEQIEDRQNHQQLALEKYADYVGSQPWFKLIEKWEPGHSDAFKAADLGDPGKEVDNCVLFLTWYLGELRRNPLATGMNEGYFYWIQIQAVCHTNPYKWFKGHPDKWPPDHVEKQRPNARRLFSLHDERAVAAIREKISIAHANAVRAGFPVAPGDAWLPPD